MITIESPFRIAPAKGSPPHNGLLPKGFELLLNGLDASLQADGRIYDVSTQGREQDAFPSRAVAWSCSVFRLPNGVSVEQQLLVPNAGDVAAISWKTSGLSPSPIMLTVTPLFSADRNISSDSFVREFRANGGRLVWQPFSGAGRMIADTNGRFRPMRTGINASALDDSINRPHAIATPASFEFQLSSQPSILILSAESQENSCGDPIIGGFLAHLAKQKQRVSCEDERDDLRSLAAA